MTTLAEMEAQRDALDEECSDIKLQLEHARARVHSDGEYSDPHWFAKANHALRCKRREYNALLQKISAIRKAERQERQEGRDRAFIDVCRRRLTEETFRELWDEADAGLEASQGAVQ